MVIVSFMLVALDTATVDPYLWRFLVDRCTNARHRRALDIVEAEMRSRGAKAIGVSYVVGKGGPAPFYAGRGYEPTGEVSDGETVARKVLD
jgi:diamine N-acetyltransferase